MHVYTHFGIHTFSAFYYLFIEKIYLRNIMSITVAANADNTNGTQIVCQPVPHDNCGECNGDDMAVFDDEKDQRFQPLQVIN